ncbi:MAG: ABC transporter substrate-binding protein, partial [Oscillospiraceae bacterium]|nr:ABC transporter substrate-binding protein [Oscillospiraceae bacterium]
MLRFRKPYAVSALLCAGILLCCTACTGAQTPAQPSGAAQMPLSYAEQFSVTYRPDGCADIAIADGQQFLLVPEGTPVPADTGTATVLQQPLEGMYIAATSAVDLFDGFGALGSVRMVSSEDWSLPHVSAALADGSMLYAGKYSRPDYELILSEHCGLAVESTMIYHTPEIKEQLEQLGIPVLVERSSYETHPMGRMEWMKLYGLLLGRAEEAEAAFAAEDERFQAVALDPVPEENRPTVAFFYITSGGYVNIRKPGDYTTRMIGLAGGNYCFTAEDLAVEDNALSTMNIQMERFYELAQDVDIFIYNRSIDGDLRSIDQLIG